MDADTAFGKFSITQEDLFLFHAIDRRLYTILVIHLLRDPVQSMHIMALWIWLERVGFDNTVVRMLSLPHAVISELADEAVVCLNIITFMKMNNSGNTNSVTGANKNLSLTRDFLKKDISVQFFHENGLLAAEGMERVMKEICVKALTDIMHHATMTQNQAMGPYAHFQPTRPRPIFPQVVVGQHEVQVPKLLLRGTPESEILHQVPVQHEVQAPQVLWGTPDSGLAHPVPVQHEVQAPQVLWGTPDSGLAHPVPVQHEVPPQVIVGQHEIHLPQVAWGTPQPATTPPVLVPSEQRSMFVTFSKGYPVSEGEVKEFFNKIYGDCIESLIMQEVLHPQDQALYARVVFNTPSIIENILNGKDKVKFVINGKHVWARKYVPKKPSSDVPMPSEGPNGGGGQYPYVHYPYGY